MEGTQYLHLGYARFMYSGFLSAASDISAEITRTRVDIQGRGPTDGRFPGPVADI